MSAVRFLYTSQPGKGFEELISPEQQLKNWLRDNLRQPNSGNVRYFDKGLGVTLQDDLVICTYLTRQLDDNRRPFIRNHSILIPKSEYNRQAGNFHQSIMAHIQEDDEAAISDGQLKPLSLAGKETNGLGKEELETLVSYRGWDIERLLESLIAGKAFSVQVKGTQDEAIALAIMLLKIAALGKLPVPQLSTFEPNGKTRTWYSSQVLPTSHARLDVQFQPKESPGKEALEQSEGLVRAVRNLDPDGIASAMNTFRNYDEVRQNSTSPKVAATPAAKDTESKNSPQQVGGQEIYQYNKNYEAYLNAKKEDLDNREEALDDRKKALDERERQLSNRVSEVQSRERDVAEDKKYLDGKAGKLDQWQHIYDICSIPHDDCRKLEERVLSRFFDEIKRLSPDGLGDMDKRVRKFIPNLVKIANSNEAMKGEFLKDVEAVKRRLQKS